MKAPIFVIGLILLFLTFAYAKAQPVEGDFTSALPCTSGERKLCGSDIGACRSGVRVCAANQWGACEGGKVAETEICGDGLDNDCNSQADECVNYFWIAVVVIGIIILVLLWVLSKI